MSAFPPELCWQVRVRLPLRLERLCAQLCSLLEEQSLAVVFLLRGGSQVCLERFWCVFEVWRRAQRLERKEVTAAYTQVFASMIPPLLVSTLPPPSASAVVNFSVSFCCHVLFPVDHALLLPPTTPPPRRLYSSPFPHYSHTLSSVCVGLHQWAGLSAQASDWLAAEGCRGLARRNEGEGWEQAGGQGRVEMECVGVFVLRCQG